MDNNINLFGLDESGASDEDFFALADGAEAPAEDEDQGKDPDSSEDSKDQEDKKEKSKPEPEDDLFSSAEEEEENDEEDGDEGDDQRKGPKDGDEEEEEISDKSIATVQLLKDRGLVDFELEEDEELTAEKADEILEDSLEVMFEDRIEELFDNLPDVVKNLNKFVIEGGDINKYLASVAESKATGLTPDMDLEEESNQIAAIKQGLAAEGHDNEYIEAQIEFLKDSKRLEKHGKMHFNKWDIERKKKEEALLSSTRLEKENAKKAQRRLKNKVTEFLKETEEVPGYKVSREDKRVLPSYMTDRNIKLDNGNTITRLQNDLMRVLNSPTGSYQLAKLLREAGEEGELDFKNIAKETETKVAKKVRENVRRNKNSIQKGSGGTGTKTKKPLAEYFN